MFDLTGKNGAVGVGMARARKADLVICDMLMEVFEKLAADGRHTVLLVEQHTALALEFADRALILDSGEIVHEGAAAELLARPDLLDRHVGVGLAPG